MKLTILAVVTLALGIAFGLALHGQLDGSAVAAPPCPPKCPTPTPTPTPPPQQREDQIALGAGGAANDPTFNYVPLPLTPWIAFDAGDYPSSSVFRLEVIIDLGADQTTCVRLFDLTTNSDIPGSTMCATGAPNPPDRRRLRSDPLTLPAGEHEYTLQGKSQVSIGGSSVQFSRIIVEWTE